MVYFMAWLGEARHGGVGQGLVRNSTGVFLLSENTRAS